MQGTEAANCGESFSAPARLQASRSPSATNVKIVIALPLQITQGYIGTTDCLASSSTKRPQAGEQPSNR